MKALKLIAGLSFVGFLTAQNWSPVKTVNSGAQTLISPAVALLKMPGGQTGVILTAIDHWEGKDYWRYVIGWNFSSQGEAIWTNVGKVPSGGNELTGGGVATADLNGNGKPDVILVAIDTWKGKDYWRLVIGQDIDNYGKANWSEVKTVYSGGQTLRDGGVAVGDINGDGKLDIVLAAIDHWKGKDYWRYVIGWNLSASGDANWTEPKTVYSGAQTLRGGGVALADINGDGKLDIVLAAIDHWKGKDYWRYVIGWNPSPTGEANWTQVKQVTSGGQTLEGGDVALCDVDGNGKIDIVLSAIDTWQGKDYWRYAIGWDVSQYGEANWSTINKIYGGGQKLLGGKMVIADLTGDGKKDILLTAVDTWKGKDYWRYVIGTGFSK